MKIIFIPGPQAEEVKKLAQKYIAKRAMEIYKSKIAKRKDEDK